MINICTHYPEQEIKMFNAIVYFELEIEILNTGKTAHKHIQTFIISTAPWKNW